MKKAIPIILLLLVGLVVLVACAGGSTGTETDTVAITSLKTEVRDAFDKLTIATDLVIDSEKGVIAFTVENEQSEIALSDIELSSGSFAVTSLDGAVLSSLILSEGLNTFTMNVTSDTVIVSYTLKITRKSANSTDPVIDPEPEHTHIFADAWSKDEYYHWHAATCEHTTEVKDKGVHAWNTGEITTPATKTTEGVKTYTCRICGATKTEKIPTSAHVHTYAEEWSYDEGYHWHLMNCGCEDDDETEDIRSDYEEHTFDPITHECKCGWKEQVELVFVDYNERVLNALAVDYGTELTLSEAVESPERNNYIFKGWQLNDSYIERYNAISEATFYASYKVAYTVFFVANSTIVESQIVEEDGDAVLPRVIPQQDGYIFTGWEDYTKITENKTIYAQFDPISYAVKYIMPDGKQIGQTQTIDYGANAAEPVVDMYWFNTESYHLYLFTCWTFAGKMEWTYSDIEHDVVLQYNNDQTKAPLIIIEAAYNTEYQLPIVLIENCDPINDTTTTINLSIILPSGNDCFLYGLDLRFAYADISINGDSLNTGSVFYGRTLTSDYNNKTKEFSLVWTSNNSGINYSNQQIIDTITINRPNKQVLVDVNNFILQDDSSLVIASTNDASYESMQIIIPIVVCK